MRTSSKKTPIAILRSILGLSVKEFAEIIGKRPSTIPALETGRLSLSEGTASRIAQETGVALSWLLDGDPNVKPYSEMETGPVPWNKEIFETVQAMQRPLGLRRTSYPDVLTIITMQTLMDDWLPIFNAAVKAEKGYLAQYYLKRFLQDMRKKFGEDHTKLPDQLRLRYRIKGKWKRLGIHKAIDEDKEISPEDAQLIKEVVQRIRDRELQQGKGSPEDSES